MNNGRITTFRIVASAVIGLAIIGAGSFLLYSGVKVPDYYWFAGALAIAGVVGLDIVVAIWKSLQK